MADPLPGKQFNNGPAQAARPAASAATFAPECLVPGGALPQRRRRGGANLAGFRSMAGGLFGKK